MAIVDTGDTLEDTGQVSTGVEILLPMSHNIMTCVDEHAQ